MERWTEHRIGEGGKGGRGYMGAVGGEWVWKEYCGEGQSQNPSYYVAPHCMLHPNETQEISGLISARLLAFIRPTRDENEREREERKSLREGRLCFVCTYIHT